MQTVFTLGTQAVEGKGDQRNEVFTRLVQKHEIDAVFDIRLHNEGRYYEFASGKNIKRLCESIGVAYVHETLFAPTRELLEEWRSHQDWQGYEHGFRKLLHERDVSAIWEELAGECERPLLLCAEETAEHCHRRLLAEHIVEKGGGEVVHLS